MHFVHHSGIWVKKSRSVVAVIQTASPTIDVGLYWIQDCFQQDLTPFKNLTEAYDDERRINLGGESRVSHQIRFHSFV